MNAYYKTPDKGDPSEILQLFPEINLQLLCCRYWWLKSWEFNELSYPYWRIYWNNREGAFISSDNASLELGPQKLVVIAPNTSYSARIGDNEIPQSGYNLEGGRVGEEKTEEQSVKDEDILHLFIHFNIGIPYDNIMPGIYEFEVSDHLFEKISQIRDHLKKEFARFDFIIALVIQSLILDLLSAIPGRVWALSSKDYRIINALGYIENNIGGDLSNEVLARLNNMATNAFHKLFRDELSISPQQYVRKKRIEKACALLHHSTNSIEIVAQETGFADRYHFSKIFKKVTGVSPARYKREFRIS